MVFSFFKKFDHLCEKADRFGDDVCAMEELVAELGQRFNVPRLGSHHNQDPITLNISRIGCPFSRQI